MPDLNIIHMTDQPKDPTDVQRTEKSQKNNQIAIQSTNLQKASKWPKKGLWIFF